MHDLWLTKYELSKTNYLSLKYHGFGNKAGKLLSHLIKGAHKPTFIFSLLDAQGSLVTSNEQINEVFRPFYAKLYVAPAFPSNAAVQFFNTILLPKVTEAQLNDLNAPITAADVTHVVRNLSNGKALSPDGYTSEFYKTFQDTLVPTNQQRKLCTGLTKKRGRIPHIRDPTDRFH